ncbi:MAG: DUF4097 family beta strand repeat-containing protein [Butyrivibrio sp.]
MKKFYIIFGIIAGALLICGTALVGVGIAAGADTNIEIPHVLNIKYSGKKDVHREYIETEEFDTIKADINFGEIDIIEGDTYAVELISVNSKYDYEIKNGVLYITQKDEKTLFNFDFSLFGGLDDYYVKIYVPDTDKIINKIDIDANMGAVKINIPVKVDYIYVDADMGDVEINNASVCNMELDADMGNIIFNGITYDGGKITANADMGNVELTGYLGCDIEVDCNMGNAEVTTYYSSDCYKYDVDSDMGHAGINRIGGVDIDESYRIYVNCDMGNAELNFVNP